MKVMVDPRSWFEIDLINRAYCLGISILRDVNQTHEEKINELKCEIIKREIQKIENEKRKKQKSEKQKRECKLIDVIKKWNEFSIENQDGLKKEHEGMEFPEWNKGYRECLEDLKKLIKENS